MNERKPRREQKWKQSVWGQLQQASCFLLKNQPRYMDWRRIPKMDRKMTEDSDQDSSERKKSKIKMTQTNGRMFNFTHKKCKKWKLHWGIIFTYYTGKNPKNWIACCNDSAIGKQVFSHIHYCFNPYEGQQYLSKLYLIYSLTQQCHF